MFTIERFHCRSFLLWSGFILYLPDVILYLPEAILHFSLRLYLPEAIPFLLPVLQELLQLLVSSGQESDLGGEGIVLAFAVV